MSGLSARPVYGGRHGTDAARRWHQAHGQPCRACWPTPDGLPPLPESTARPTGVDRASLDALIREVFDTPEETL